MKPSYPRPARFVFIHFLTDTLATSPLWVMGIIWIHGFDGLTYWKYAGYAMLALQLRDIPLYIHSPLQNRMCTSYTLNKLFSHMGLCALLFIMRPNFGLRMISFLESCMNWVGLFITIGGMIVCIGLIPIGIERFTTGWWTHRRSE